MTTSEYLGCFISASGVASVGLVFLRGGTPGARQKGTPHASWTCKEETRPPEAFILVEAWQPWAVHKGCINPAFSRRPPQGEKQLSTAVAANALVSNAKRMQHVTAPHLTQQPRMQGHVKVLSGTRSIESLALVLHVIEENNRRVGATEKGLEPGLANPGRGCLAFGP
eukprot:1161486-Pelagomonas_calceolata.AAC.10